MPLNSLDDAREHQKANRLAEAESICRKFLKTQPDDIEALNLLGTVLRQSRKFSGAINALRKSLELNPAQADVQSDLGTCLIQSRQPAAAVDAFRASIALNPNLAATHNNLGACLRFLGQYDQAVAACQKAIELRPNYAHAMTNLGAALSDMGKSAEAIPMHLKALELDPQLREPHWNLAMACLRAGDLKRGFFEYEWRLKGPDAVKLSDISQPRWDGSPLNGKTILLHGEQGMGDILQFVRYVPLVAARGGKIVIACHIELCPLLRRMPFVEQAVPFNTPLPPCDVFCPMMSLPLAFETTQVNIPAYCPYLQPPRDLAKSWQQRLGSRSAAPRVGLVWAGGSKYKDDALRSLHLADLAPLAQLPGFEFHSLQKGPAAGEATHPAAPLRLIDHADQLNDFADTAALMANLDLVISVDTAAAHLAGALGKPVWLLLPTPADWRWMLHRVDNPWYPTMTLFRQTSPGKWNDVIGRIAQALATGQRRAPAV